MVDSFVDFINHLLAYGNDNGNGLLFDEFVILDVMIMVIMMLLLCLGCIVFSGCLLWIVYAKCGFHLPHLGHKTRRKVHYYNQMNAMIADKYFNEPGAESIDDEDSGLESVHSLQSSDAGDNDNLSASESIV